MGWPCLTLDGTVSSCKGYCIDLLKLLMRDVGFSAEIQVVKDGKYGALNHSTGQWSGLIGAVVRVSRFYTSIYRCRYGCLS